MTKKIPNFMNISGWLPVSYSIYKILEDDALNWLVRSTKEDVFYSCLKIIADTLNDNIKMSNEKLIKILNTYLKKEYKTNIFDENKMIVCINFIRDSLIIYNHTIDENKEFKFETY